MHLICQFQQNFYLESDQDHQTYGTLFVKSFLEFQCSRSFSSFIFRILTFRITWWPFAVICFRFAHWIWRDIFFVFCEITDLSNSNIKWLCKKRQIQTELRQYVSNVQTDRREPKIWFDGKKREKLPKPRGKNIGRKLQKKSWKKLKKFVNGWFVPCVHFGIVHDFVSNNLRRHLVALSGYR